MHLSIPNLAVRGSILLLLATWTLIPIRLLGAGSEAAWLQGARLGTGRVTLTSTRSIEIAWNDLSSVDPTVFEHSALHPSRLIIKTPGDYFVAGTLPITSNGTDRTASSLELFVNGRARRGGIGQSSYIRNASGHNESSVHIHFLVTDLQVDDYLELRTRRISTAQTTAEMQEASFYVERVDESRSVFAATSSQTNSGTNLNIEVDTDDTGLQWQAERKDGDFDHSEEGATVTLRTAGTYFLTVNIPLRGTVARGSVALEIKLDGERAPSGLAQQGYIRNSSGHTNSSLHWAGLVTTSRANQRLTIDTFQRGTEGTITIQRGKDASIFIEKLSSLDGVFHASAFDTEAGESWNTAQSPILWDGPDQIIDSAVFDHSPGNTAHEVTVKEAGNYLLIYNDSIEGGATRANPRIAVQINGDSVPGAETKTHYIRNADGHINSSATLVFYLEDLKSNDTITLTAEREGGGGDPIAEEPATLTLIRKPIYQPDDSLALPPRVTTIQSDLQGFDAIIEEFGIPIDQATIKATVEETLVPLEVTAEDNKIAVQFRFPEIPTPRSTHDVVLTFQDKQVVPQEYTIPFRIVVTTPFRILPPEFARLEPDESRPGFVARISQISALQSGETSVHGNQINSAKRQLSGSYRDRETGEPYLNEAGPLTATEWEFSDAVIETVINLEQDGSDVGNFTSENGYPDDFVPHIPGWNDSLDGIAADFTTFLDLQPGFYTFGVNSDDGFEVSSDPMIEGERPLVLGSFNGGRGSADTLFNVVVRTPGLYPFTLLWFEAGGGANVEFFHLHEGERILINDRDHPAGIRAYQQATGRPEPPAPDVVEIQSISQQNGRITIEFTGSLAASSNPEGPYTPLANINSPYTFSPTQTVRFFRAQ